MIYLDHHATTPVDPAVLQEMLPWFTENPGNPHSRHHEFGWRAEAAVALARKQIADLIGADDQDIIFTSGTTMSINMVAQSWGQKFLSPGDEILLNEMEHHANLVPWQMVAQQTGATLNFIPLTEDGQLDLTQLDQVLTEQTRLVSVTAMSNILGTITPMKTLSDNARSSGALFMVDAAQSVPHASINVQEIGADFLAFSGHKIFGPTGIGVLYGREDLLDQMNPFLGGGHMIERVWKDHSTWAPLPAKFEAGTIPITPAIALGTAIDYVTELGFDAIHAHEQALAQKAWHKLNEIPGIKIHGPDLEKRGAIFSFTMDGAHPEDIAQLLNRKGVFVRHGHHCTMPLHDLLNLKATVRASFAVYNTLEEVDALIDGLHFTRQKLRLEQA